MRKGICAIVAAWALVIPGRGSAIGSVPSDMPVPEPPVFRPVMPRENEKPVTIETACGIVAVNALYCRVAMTLTFTNPNARPYEGDLEFPLAEGATVCGYALEVNGTMVPGVICGKEETRTAFENGRRKGAVPGLVENVRGNVWKTRIYPLMPGVPRKARVEFIRPICAPAGTVVVEKDGEDVYVGEAREPSALSRAERLREAAAATIYWDASMSRQGRIAADRNLLECLPEKGTFKLVVFRNVIERPIPFDSRAALLAAVDALAYDGGTCLEQVLRETSAVTDGFLFTDEMDAEAASNRRVRVRKLAAGEKAPAEPREGKLLATAWAADRIADLGAQAQERKAEFLALGRRYGVASPVTSLLVLETLEQYLANKVEPPREMPFHAEWVRRRAEEDDSIAAAQAKNEHLLMLLCQWEERVKWWNAPIPPKNTPSSGFFSDTRETTTAVKRRRRVKDTPPESFKSASAVAKSGSADDWSMVDAEDGEEMVKAMKKSSCSSAAAESKGSVAGHGVKMSRPTRRSRRASRGAGDFEVATIAIVAWNPKMPYLTAIGAAKDAYAEYLAQRDVHGRAPAFYFDCAGWFFKAKQGMLAVRILSNLSEMRLEDVGMWRTMGRRLREAGFCDEAVKVFRHVLEMRPEEQQSKRDLALVLMERGKSAWETDQDSGLKDIREAIGLFRSAAFEPTARRSGCRSNDIQTSVSALEELNGIRMWWGAMKIGPAFPVEMDVAFARDMPCELRIVLSWDTDETDVDLHVLEPDGEEAYYGNRRTSSGGFVSENVTTGYGPEEYLRKTADKGIYRILANYFASHRQALTGAATATATVYTGWGTATEKREMLSFRLDKPNDRHSIGEVKIGTGRDEMRSPRTALY